MANLSQEKRQRMLAFLETIREEHKDDDEVLICPRRNRKRIKRKEIRPRVGTPRRSR